MSVFDYSVPSFLKNGSRQSAKLCSWLTDTLSQVKFALENIDTDNFSDVSQVRGELLGSTTSELATAIATSQVLTSDVAGIKEKTALIQTGRTTVTGITGAKSITTTVKFPKPFRSTPIVVLTPHITIPNMVYYSVSGVSEDSFTLHCYYTGATGTKTGLINWVAIGDIGKT